MVSPLPSANIVGVMPTQNFLRTLLFVVFSGIGAAALSGAALCDDLLDYYRNKQLLNSAADSLELLESLNADYDALTKALHEDPNLIDRIIPATLGTKRQSEDTIYPKLTPEQLDAARKALTEDSDLQLDEPEIPRWIVRCSEPGRRKMLFAAGAILILIAFVFFTSNKPADNAEVEDT